MTARQGIAAFLGIAIVAGGWWLFNAMCKESDKEEFY